MTSKDSGKSKKTDAEVYDARSSEHAVAVRLLENFQALPESEIDTDGSSVVLRDP